ncbi:RyR domain protein [Frankia sp. CcI156]|jgi:hypothetical protein|uniref:Ryanodine receptor Ryr domain-containing protein n=1 Tax=Frankia casuarinae (strain DSM 45818 / CECT 9043 / HFP020203 / CcI3) TaxID=106370 RepID=Q2JDU7_FRACC|nr:RyR domain-containing protein [Frankia sp. CcI156]ABD10545.1 hypothetical protein Francci3_1166 [Frankia casuarinae]ETA03126.1 hypothetical protein CcI6DRAFT_01445 [Frankia sp. CcI6]KDA42945.1 hypothetical protein BMG523Draft_02170 [Frankia sp. BMG5.23]KFB06110.1 RyR domain [Frankia sp. Allo2]OHV53978.1 RyR domain protein [Frankia sp. CgIS1]ORT53563.1 RyR domain protein [Frankia sp. KB5]TFE34397.1 RyR domain protein [Frankia sp. B2]
MITARRAVRGVRVDALRPIGASRPAWADAVGGDGGVGGTPSVLGDGELVEQLARAIHDRYLEHELGKRHAAGSRPGLRPWAELSEALREANRDQAVHYETVLRNRGWVCTPAEQDVDPAVDPFSLSAAEVEELARAEHDRWRQHKERQGYSYGPVREDLGPDKRHPSMVDWEELTEEDRDRDRDAIRNMPAVLARADLCITRRPAAEAAIR